MNSKPWQELLITYDSDKSEMSPITSHHCWFLFTTTIIICPPHRTLSLQPHITYPIPQGMCQQTSCHGPSIPSCSHQEGRRGQCSTLAADTKNGWHNSKGYITFGQSLASFPEDRPTYRCACEHACDHIHTSHLEHEHDHNHNHISHTEHEPGCEGEQVGEEEDDVRSQRVASPSCKLVSTQDEVAQSHRRRQEGPMWMQGWAGWRRRGQGGKPEGGKPLLQACFHADEMVQSPSQPRPTHTLLVHTQDKDWWLPLLSYN